MAGVCAVGFLKAGMVSAILAIATVTAANADILININKATQRMTVSVDGVQRYNWPVSTGKPGYATSRLVLLRRGFDGLVVSGFSQQQRVSSHI
jgi:hypothetical protein